MLGKELRDDLSKEETEARREERTIKPGGGEQKEEEGMS